jgi:hypothetical protein
MRSRQPPQQPKPKQDPRKSSPDDETLLLDELRKLGPRKPPKRVRG